MKKLLVGVLIGVIGFLSIQGTVKADQTLYGFLDGTYYNQDSVLLYFCFQDGSCFDISGKKVVLQIFHPSLPTPTVTTTPNTYTGDNSTQPTQSPVITPVPPSTPAIETSCTLSAIQSPSNSKTDTLTWSTTGITGDGTTQIGTMKGASTWIGGVPQYDSRGIVIKTTSGSLDVGHDAWIKMNFGSTFCNIITP